MNERDRGLGEIEEYEQPRNRPLQLPHIHTCLKLLGYTVSSQDEIDAIERVIDAIEEQRKIDAETEGREYPPIAFYSLGFYALSHCANVGTPTHEFQCPYRVKVEGVGGIEDKTYCAYASLIHRRDHPKMFELGPKKLAEKEGITPKPEKESKPRRGRDRGDVTHQRQS